MYNICCQTEFKTPVIGSILCDFSDAHILFRWIMTVPNTETVAARNVRNRKVILKNCAPFTNCISEINNKEMDHTNGIEYSDNHLKTTWSLWQYYRDESFTNNDGVVFDVPDDSGSASFKYKQKITSQAGNDRSKDIQIMIPLKYLNIF